jgi:hypothetical protein
MERDTANSKSVVVDGAASPSAGRGMLFSAVMLIGITSSGEFLRISNNFVK